MKEHRIEYDNGQGWEHLRVVHSEAHARQQAREFLDQNPNIRAVRYQSVYGWKSVAKREDPR